MPHRDRLSLTDADRAAFAAARAAAHGKAPGVWPAVFFLRGEKRCAADALIGFFTMAAGVFDTAEESQAAWCSDPRTPVLDLLAARIDALYADERPCPPAAHREPPEHILDALHLTIRRYSIPRQHFADWIDGLREGQAALRYATWTSLQRHCRLVYGSLALISSCVLGLMRSDVGDAITAVASGIGLSRILQRVGADRVRGRIYLPLEDLARFGYGDRDLLAGTCNDPLRRLLRFEVQRARGLLAGARELMPWLAGDGSRAAVASVIVESEALLDQVERCADPLAPMPPRSRLADLRRLPRIWALARAGSR